MGYLFPRAYVSELLLLLFAIIAWVLVAWMAWSTGRDLYRAALANNDPRWKFSLGMIYQGFGYFAAELWRLFEVTLLLSIGLWSVLHSIDDLPVNAWDLQQNLRPDRVIALLITGAKMMAGLTARYFRGKANRADGIFHD
jgi:hypothetical protein